MVTLDVQSSEAEGSEVRNCLVAKDGCNRCHTAQMSVAGTLSEALG